jgi:hypothetical protein
MKTTLRSRWLAGMFVVVVGLGVLSLFGPRGAAMQESPPPFNNSVEQRNEIIAQLKELNAQLKEQNTLLRSGNLKVIVSLDKKQ